VSDPDPRVRDAASWWPARQAALAAAGHGDAFGAVARAAAHVRAVADQARTLADRAHPLVQDGG
jgi:hypothetical protein